MGFLFSKPKYDPSRDIPDLTGKVALVTGANTGVGFETALQLAKRGAKVYLGCRSETRAKDAIARMRKTSPELDAEDKIVWLPLDLSVMRLAKKAGEELLSKETRLDILVNNAAWAMKDYELSEDGIEKAVAVNYLGHFVLAETVLPLMKSTAQLPGADVRIVSVASIVYDQAGSKDFSSLEALNSIQGKPGKEDGWFSKLWRYATSKFQIVLWVGELQRRLDAEGTHITVIALHPGAVNTDGLANGLPSWALRLVHPFSATPLQGAFTSLFAATSEEVAAAREKYKGAFLVPYGKLLKLTKEATDPVLAKTLWETSEGVVRDALQRREE
ncbi:NAD-P-binding protein [Stereum hirsutum FP-91666 SS1]|uniref:NAD-P-binding protein n=1 Tax=Stereum hirsutum (strain FP-91666) TaxID=721885 RepID=UPI000440C249|nr:NAD-P-binding protein [Stereum hirsutum FP-91666 SS1]EIM89871.1 NAD-P-binding protein [Stereum hirsutum FP-91666 SS1]